MGHRRLNYPFNYIAYRHLGTIQKVGEIADKNPRETVSIIRQWLQESAAA